MSKRKIECSEFTRFINCISNILENRHEDTIDIDDMIKELKYCVEKAETIIDVMKNKPKAFSNIKYNDLVKMNDIMKWNLPKDLHRIEDFRPKLIRIPNYMLEIIKNELQTKTQTIGILSTTNNEEKRKPFIDTFVYSCINMFQGEITNDMEGYINGSVFQGRIEYILKAFSEIIIVIIEAKKDVEYQGNYGQIISELYNSYWYNRSINMNTEYVCGILTTGENWQWWKYDGIQFYATKEFMGLRNEDRKSLPKIASYVCSIIIESWFESCKIYFKKYLNDNGNSLIKELNQNKNEIFDAKTDNDSLTAFNRFKVNIKKLKEILGYEENGWDYDVDYLE